MQTQFKLSPSLRVLHVTPVYEPAYVYGGPVRSISALCKALAGQGVEVTVFTTNANGATTLDVPVNEPVERDGVTVWYFQRDSAGSYHYSRQLGQACAERIKNFDLVQTSGVWNYALAAAAEPCRKAGVPHIVSPRNALTKWAYNFKPLKKRLYMWAGERQRLNQATALHYTTELEQSESAFLNLRPGSFVVPNPVDIERFAALVAKGFLRQKLGLGQNIHLAGMVGRLHPVKGYDLAIKALAQIGEDVHLALVGPDEGGYLAHIRQLAQLYNVQARLHWLGQLEGEELVAAYADMDSFLLPSQSENFGNVVVEAMAVGLPVLISNRVGVAAEVAQARAGLVYPLKVEALVEALREITTQPGRGREMGQRGRALAKGQYAPETVAQTMLEFYRQLLGKELTGARI